MDNTLFDFVAAKQHACREVAKYLDRDDGEALFTCFINSPHGFESHENIRDYFDLCGLLEGCSSGKSSSGCTACGEGGSGQPIVRTLEDGQGTLPDAPASPGKDVPDAPLPEKENVVRIQISQVSRSPAISTPPGTPLPEKAVPGQRINVPSACAIPAGNETALQVPGAYADRGTGYQREPSSGQPGTSRPPLLPVRDNLVEDKSLYCNEVFARCCEIYETEKIRVLEPYPGVRETLAELKRRGLPLAIVTDAHNGNALTRLYRTGLAEFFDHVISYDMTGAKKPAPDAFLLALRKLGTKPSETLLVGDSIRRDIAPAKELGMITAYAAYGDRNIKSRDPTGVKPDIVLGDIRELADQVELPR